MRYLFATLTAFVALACGSATDPTLTPDFSVGIGEPFDLRIGEAVTLDGGLTIGFSAVVGDSRCPRSVTCVWAGDGAVELTIRQANDVSADTLHTMVEPRSITAGGVEIQLTELAPYPSVPGTIPSSRYVATFTTQYAP